MGKERVMELYVKIDKIEKEKRRKIYKRRGKTLDKQKCDILPHIIV